MGCERRCERRHFLAEERGLGWGEIEGVVRRAALAAAEENRWPAAEGWVLAAKWARLLGENQREVAGRWVQAINSARLGHANMRAPRGVPDAELAAILSRETVVALMGDVAVSRAFFDLVRAYDYLPAVLGVLKQLRAGEAAGWAAYA